MTGRTLKFGDSVSGSILEILEKSHGFSVNIFYIFKAVGSVDFDKIPVHFDDFYYIYALIKL